MVLYHAHDGVLRQAVFRRIMSKDTIRLTFCMKKEQQSKYKQNKNFSFRRFSYIVWQKYIKNEILTYKFLKKQKGKS